MASHTQADEQNATLSRQNAAGGQSQKPADDFDWVVYSDATLAGLSALIPVPYVDSAVERYFRLRMLPTIAARNDAVLHPQANKFVNHVRFDLVARAGGCLLWPLELGLNLLRRFSRKVVYVFTVKRAVDKLSHYWQRAFLLNHMVEQGLLRDPATIRPSAHALESVLRAHTDGPLVGLARQVVAASANLLGNLRPRRIRRWSGPDMERGALVRNASGLMRSSWGQYEEFFAQLRQEYEQAYDQAVAQERRGNARV